MKLRKICPLLIILCATMFAHSEEMREITPNAGPCVTEGADVFITANFIWWKATQDTLGYAITGVASVSSTNQNLLPATGVTGRGNVHDPDFGWEPGFKVGLGLSFDYDGWDLYSQYTWFQSNDSDTSSGIAIFNDVPDVLAGIGGTQPLGDVTRNAKWNLHFNVIDLELGRNFYLSRRLMLRPHFGLKGTWQEQNFRSIIATESEFFALSQILPGPYHLKQRHSTWGLGIRAGLDTAWHFTKNWSIFGDVSWSAMWTHYNVDRLDQFTLAFNPESLYTFVDTKMTNYRVRYVGELELGLRFEFWFYGDDYHLVIQAGWEEQVWVNYGNFIRLYNDVQGDLTLHGLNLKFRFDF